MAAQTHASTRQGPKANMGTTPFNLRNCLGLSSNPARVRIMVRAIWRIGFIQWPGIVKYNFSFQPKSRVKFQFSCKISLCMQNFGKNLRKKYSIIMRICTWRSDSVFPTCHPRPVDINNTRTISRIPTFKKSKNIETRYISEENSKN